MVSVVCLIGIFLAGEHFVIVHNGGKIFHTNTKGPTIASCWEGGGGGAVKNARPVQAKKYFSS